MCCTISGNAHASSGRALATARVELRGNAPIRTVSDGNGTFSLTAPGGYELVVSTRGYERVVAVNADHDVPMQVALGPIDSPKRCRIGQIHWSNGEWHAATSAAVRGHNNELKLTPSALANALIGKHVSRDVDLSLALSDLFNVTVARFTVFGGGVPYRGIVTQNNAGEPVYGPLPTTPRTSNHSQYD